LPDISGLCSNGFISCPSGEWYGNGVSCNNYALLFTSATGLALQQLGSSIMATPSTSKTNVVVNGTSTSSVTSTKFVNGLANCYCLNNSCPDTNGNAKSTSPSYLKENLIDLGGIVSSAVTLGSSDQITGATITGPASKNNYISSIVYSGDACNTNSNYNSANSLEGLYNKGGSSLGNEVSGSQDATANSNTASALGMSSSQTPNNLLITAQNNSFGGATTGTCQILNGVSGGQCAMSANLSFSGSWNIGQYGNNNCQSTGSSYSNGTTYSITPSGTGNTIAAGGNSTNWCDQSAGTAGIAGASGTLTFSTKTVNGVTGQTVITGSLNTLEFGGSLSYGPIITGSSDTINGNAGGSITYNSSTNSFSGSTTISTDTGTATLTGSANCITDSQGGSICVNQESSPTCTGITLTAAQQWVFTNQTYYFPLNSNSNSCSTYTSNPKCTLTDKQVCDANDNNCITTESNNQVTGSAGTYTPSNPATVNANSSTGDTFTWQFIYTGSSITANASGDTTNVLNIPATFAVSGSGNAWPITNETYSCTGKQKVTIPPISSVSASSPSSSNPNKFNSSATNNNFSYTITNANGTTQSGSNVPINNNMTEASSPEQCEIEQTANNTNVTSSTTAMTANQNTPSDSMQTTQKFINCTNSGTVNNPTWVCPVPTTGGWTQKIGCEPATKANNGTFGSSVAELEVMDKAAQSLICSSSS
jgi:hypothetical protein